MKRHGLLLRFSLLSLAAFLVVGLTLGIVVTSSLEENVVDRSRDESARFVAAEVDRVFPGRDFSLPMTGPQYEDFRKEVPHLQFHPSIKRIKIWNLDRVVVWSDERQLVGKRFPNNKELVEALNGPVTSKIISPRNKHEARTEGQYSRLLELYIPIRSEREGNISAVFEIYQDLESLDADISRQKRVLWASIFAGFTGVYFACFGIVWRASGRLTEQALEIEKSEERNRNLAKELTSLINNVPGMVYRGHRDWSLSFIGAEVEPVTGYSAEEFMSGAVNWKTLIHPDDQVWLKEFLRKAVRDQLKTLRVEYRITHKNGGIRWIADRRQMMYDETGAFDYVDGLLLDITESRGWEQALKESEEKFRVIFEGSKDGILLADMERKRFITGNRAICRMLRYSLEEIQRLCVTDIHPEEDLPWILDAFEKAGRQEFEIASDIPVKRKDGTVFFADIKSSPVTFSGKQYVIGNFRDVTERKEAEQALTRLGLAVDQAAEAVVVTDTEGNIEYVNPAFEQITGYPREEAVGRNMRILGSGKQDETFYKEMWATLSHGEVWEGRFVNRKKDGTLYDEETTISPVRDASGKIVNFVAGKRDVTREVVLQKQVQTVQRMESVGTLAGGIAHDFNNALTGIMGYSELLRLRISGDPKGQEELDEIFRAAERAAALTRQLLTFARRQVVDPVNLDIGDVVKDLLKFFTKVAGAQIDVKTLLAAGTPTVWADRGQVEQVLMNLCLNARDAMPQGGQLIVETGGVTLREEHVRRYPYMKTGRYALLSVSDTGIGMDEATQDHIFEPFFTTKAPDKGTGLGLSVVYGIVKQHNGYIHVYSEPGKGSTFKVYLPAIDAKPDVRMPASKEAVQGGSESIILAEDEEAIRGLAERILTDYGYSVLAAKNGEEAVELFSRNQGKIALALLDVVMPRMGGKEAYGEMRKQSPSLKVIFMSGYSANAVHEGFVIKPGTPFLGKPFVSTVLLRKVREVLDNA